MKPIKPKTRHALGGHRVSYGIAKQQKRAGGVRCSLFACKHIITDFCGVTKQMGKLEL